MQDPVLKDYHLIFSKECIDKKNIYKVLYYLYKIKFFKIVFI